ncbi:hypothetical protein H4J02_08350 [Protaetiibacter sp. SSC-01]|uniref:hypothetical protein n=1 Tax=Protaetiibacter sp. SSC-01 TaxID=2759943 RepID=UPI001656A3E7|nr:hypothetical protein [Protaetiibacter sp. SSC-01]QNO36532.1 hypothetical protein H4J02_08350 [Protaetiibacter sp. SSC-01]
MIDDILGEWDLILGENGRGEWDGRIVFRLGEGRIVVADADPDASGRPSRVELAGDTVRFEMLSAGSSRGNVHHTFELTLTPDGTLRGTRRRGLLARTPLVGRRVVAETGAQAPEALGGDTHAASVPPESDALAEIRARAAAAAERARFAAAQAAAAAAEAEAAEALEFARQAAARVAAARAAVNELGRPADAAAEPRTEVPSEVLAILPAPSQPPVFAPAPGAAAPTAPVAPVSPAPVSPALLSPGEHAPASVLDDSSAAEGHEPEDSDEEFSGSLAG